MNADVETLITAEYEFDDVWSEEDEQLQQPISDLASAEKRIKHLKNSLQKMENDFQDYRAFVGERMNADVVDNTGNCDVQPRDDDTHYFSSYAENG